MKKILHIDMDGVIADFDKFIAANTHLDLEELSLLEREDIVDEIAKKFPTMFEHFEFMKGAYDAVMELKARYEIYFLSTPMSDIPESYMGKRIWLRNKFGEWADKRLILTHRKDLVKGDYLIDDRLKHGVDQFDGKHIHFGTADFPDWHSVLQYLMSE